MLNIKSCANEDVGKCALTILRVFHPTLAIVFGSSKCNA